MSFALSKKSLFLLLIGLSLCFFFPGYQILNSLDSSGRPPIEGIIFSCLLAALFPRNIIFQTQFFIFFCFYEFHFSSYILPYCTNIVPIVLLYDIVCLYNNQSSKPTYYFLIATSVYFFSGFAKIIWAYDIWIDGSVVSNLLYEEYDEFIPYSIPISLGILAWELSAPFWGIDKRFMNIFIFSAVLFHLAMFILFNINFFIFFVPCLLLGLDFNIYTKSIKSGASLKKF